VTRPYQTARRSDELLVRVRLRPWPARTAGVYVKFGLRERPTLSLALALTLDEADRVGAARLAVGCVGARPHRLAEAEGALAGQALGALDGLGEQLGALAAAAVDPVEDLHGSAEYKRELTAVFARRALAAVRARAEGRPVETRYPHAVVV
jgi:carbon-monoxide dehydrogenase medium subunit